MQFRCLCLVSGFTRNHLIVAIAGKAGICRRKILAPTYFYRGAGRLDVDRNRLVGTVDQARTTGEQK